jgi:hypothetical protein
MPLYLAGKYNNKFYLCNSRDKKTDITPFSERIQNVCRTAEAHLPAGRQEVRSVLIISGLTTIVFQ